MAVASPIDEKRIEICTAGRVIVPLLRECVDDARIPGRERNGPRFFGQAPEPFPARGQEIIDGICLTESREFFGRLRTNDLRGSRLCRRTEHLEHKSFPVRIVVQDAITTRTIGRHVPPFFFGPQVHSSPTTLRAWGAAAAAIISPDARHLGHPLQQIRKLPYADVMTVDRSG